MKLLRSMLLLVVASALSILGCGGGGGGAATGSTKIFLTDSFNDDYSQVWLRIHKVEFRDQATLNYRTAFESPSGALIDAKQLRDIGGARFSLLADGVIPIVSYDALRCTFGKQAGTDVVRIMYQPGWRFDDLVKPDSSVWIHSKWANNPCCLEFRNSVQGW